MLVIVAPGQGAQTPGFLAPWLADESCAAYLNWLSAVAGLDLAEAGTNADAEAIRDTSVAQPLLVASGLCAARSLFLPDQNGQTDAPPERTITPPAQAILAGHSVGELTAAALAGVLSAEQAMVLVRERGRQMARAASATPTSMTAILGGDPETVKDAVEAVGLTLANHNGAGQLVAAGTTEQLATLAANPPARARLAPLRVAGAFHTAHMRPAVAHLENLAQAVSARDPKTRLLTNADGRLIGSGQVCLANLVSQVANPVRWDLCLATMRRLGATGLLELPPAGTLAAIAKRNLPGVEIFTLNTPNQLADARAFVARHVDADQTDGFEAAA